MQNIFRFFVTNYKLVFVVTLLVIFSGISGLRALNSEAFPPVDFAIARIVTEYPGSSPEEVEEQITKKIEEELRSVDGIRDMTSTSQSGRSEIVVRLDMDNVDTRQKMDEVQRAVQKVSGLPPGILADPTIDEVKSAEMPIVEMALVGEQTNRERDALADDLKELLEDVNGVSNIRLDGFTERQFQVLLDPKALQKNYVGIEEVARAIQTRVRTIPAGYIRSNGTQNLLRVRGETRTIEEIGDIVVRSNFSGRRIQVKDIAVVKDGGEEARSLARMNGRPATILVVRKTADSDGVEVVQAIQRKLVEFQKRLPEGFETVIYNNEGSRIEDKLSIVIGNAAGGMVLVLVILLLFLPGKLGIITSLSLPLAILGTTALAPGMGLAFNTITMLALVIAVGMLVDNAVVISENYARLRQEGLGSEEAAVKAVHMFWLPITATGLTTIAAFLPMLVTKGIMGEFIKYIPITVTIALVMSLFESLLLLPPRLQFALRSDPKKQNKKVDEGWFRRVREPFQRHMKWAVEHRYVVAGGVALLLTASMAVTVLGNRFELFPSESVEIYIGRLEAPDMSSLAETDRLTNELTKKVRPALKDLGLVNIAARIGQSTAGPNDPQSKNGDNVAMLTITIDRDIARRQNTQLVLSALRALDKGGLKKASFEAAANGPPVGKPLNITLRSTSHSQVRSLADAMIAELGQVDGVFELEDNEVKGIREYAVEMDYDMMGRLQLSTESVGVALRTALQGSDVAQITLDDEEIDINVRYQGAYRETVDAIGATQILQPRGRLIPLASVAKIKEVDGPSIRKRFDSQRSITITGDVNPELITSVAVNKKAREVYAKLQDQYPSVSAKFGGEEENTKESVDSLFQAMIVAVFGIFAILVFMFNSYLKPILILSTIPLGLVGVCWAFFIHGKPLSFMALIGVVGLAGVVVNSGIVLMSYIDQLLSEGKDLNEALVEASASRLRAVIVTSLTTIGGLLPTAYGIGGYDALLVPMTLALAWGLATGTLLTLIWVPCGVAILNDLEQLFGKWVGGSREPSPSAYSDVEAQASLSGTQPGK